MNKVILGAITILIVSGCATAQKSESDASGSGKLAVTQIGHNQNTQLVFCESNKCPERTAKYIASPSPVPVTPPVKPSVQEIVVKAQEPEHIHFKVHFRWGWSRLDKAGREEIKSLLKVAKSKPNKQIVVAGRTDPTGSLTANKKLALMRANTVKAVLVKAGIPSDVITADAQLPCCDGDKRAAPEDLRELRRTDIDITIKTK